MVAIILIAQYGDQANFNTAIENYKKNKKREKITFFFFFLILCQIVKNLNTYIKTGNEL